MSPLLVNAAWIFLAVSLFGGLHSWLATHTVKAWARGRFGGRTADGLYRLAYNLLAGLTLLPPLALLGWLPDGPPVWRLPGGLLLLTLPLQAAALAGIVFSLWRVDLPRFLGLRQLGRLWRGQAEPRDPPSLRTDGLHGWVRHPLYFFSLVLLWLLPAVTPNLLAFNLACTLYFWIGSVFEERKLVAEFGPAYREHQRRVPRLIPWPRRRR